MEVLPNDWKMAEGSHLCLCLGGQYAAGIAFHQLGVQLLEEKAQHSGAVLDGRLNFN